MIRSCIECGWEYDDVERRGQPGLITQCNDCGEDPEARFSGNMIYTHKTGGSIQINRDPEVTAYITASTHKHAYGSNFSRLPVKTAAKREGAVLFTVGDSNAKGKA